MTWFGSTCKQKKPLAHKEPALKQVEIIQSSHSKEILHTLNNFIPTDLPKLMLIKSIGSDTIVKSNTGGCILHLLDASTAFLCDELDS